eukprot:TRINITY_DN11656_c0_g1_i1.p1 TRINITY_DN11656_c0_g1~~TRINITY_DN11656_c0_g1_i1.p1  ORF type:complete len:114 (+),score=35.75 TRINITY_DN11656_c0_g1_i1:202-543(+)
MAFLVSRVLYGRALEDPMVTRAMIFNTALPGFNPTAIRTGNSWLRRVRAGPAVAQYYGITLKEGLHRKMWKGHPFQTEEQLHATEKMADKRAQGIFPKKKGEGKKAQIAKKKK